jgi:hypothetical protein
MSHDVTLRNNLLTRDNTQSSQTENAAAPVRTGTTCAKRLSSIVLPLAAQSLTSRCTIAPFLWVSPTPKQVARL